MPFRDPEKLKAWKAAYKLKNMIKLKEKEKEYYLKYKETKKISHKKWVLKNKEHLKSYRATYRAENKERLKSYRVANKNMQKSNSAKYYLKNKEKIKASVHKYRKTNKYLYHSYQKKYFVDRYRLDDIFRLRLIIGSQLRDSLKRQNVSKHGRSWEKMLGYTKKELKIHLEKQFTKGMSWANFGSFWHVDHVVPISWFKTYEQVIKRGWALKNLQPLEAKLNVAKNNCFSGNPKTNLGVIYL